MDTGWIRLHRKIRDNSLWPKNRRFTALEAWLDVLMSANHAPAKTLLGITTPVPVKRGQFITSQVGLAERWKWNRRTVTRFLSMLKKDEMLDIETKKGGDIGFTLITIQNYNTYQDKENKENDALDIETGSKGTFDGQSKGHSMDNNKNVKNAKKEDMGENLHARADPTPDQYTVEFAQIKAIYPHRDGDQRWQNAFGHYRAARKGGEPMETILTGVQRYRAWCEDKRKIGTETVKQAASFLGREKCWRESWEVPQDPAGGFVG